MDWTAFNLVAAEPAGASSALPLPFVPLFLGAIISDVSQAARRSKDGWVCVWAQYVAPQSCLCTCVEYKYLLGLCEFGRGQSRLCSLESGGSHLLVADQ